MAAETRQAPFKSEIKDSLAQWTTRAKLLFGVLLTGAVLLLIIVFYIFSTDNQHRLLYANLTPEDYLALSNWLRFRDIDFTSDPEQSAIFVAADRLNQTRLEMAEDKLPATGGNGEILSRGRAQPLMDVLTGGDRLVTVQHELSKTISALDHVRTARVHISFPPEDRFSAGRPRATVLLTLIPGGTLSAEQLHGVIHLVSASVSGLHSEDVRVFDSSGRLLSTDNVLLGANYFPDSTLAYQASLERSLEKKAQDLVDALIGGGRTLIKVAAELDFARNETTAERYDPDESVVKSEQIERQPMADAGSLAGSESSAEQSSAARYRAALTTSSKVDYEISRTTSRTIRPVGEIKRLSVTILVADEKIIASDGSASFQPPSADALEEIRALVSGALPLKPDRGDVVNLARMPLPLIDAEPFSTTMPPFYYLFELIPVGTIILLLLIFILFYFLLFRPILGLLRSGLDQQRSEAHAPDEHIHAAKQPEDPQEELSVKVQNEVQSNPLAAAHIIKKWLQEA